MEIDWIASLRAIWSVTATSSLFLLRLVQLLVLTLLRLALVPISALLRFVLVLFSPVTFLGQYALAFFYFGYDMIVSLKPLYIFFGCATLVGIVTGVILHYTSSMLSSVCGLDDDSGAIIETVSEAQPLKWKAEDESSRLDWAPLEKSWQKNAPKAQTRKWETPGLRTQTILEEVDDS